MRLPYSLTSSGLVFTEGGVLLALGFTATLAAL